MEAYKRYSNSGHEIVWGAEDEECCCRAVVECNKTDVSSSREAVEKCPIEVEKETAREIKNLYHQYRDDDEEDKN